MNTFFYVIINIVYAIGLVVGAMFAYKAILGIIGVFTRQRFKKTKNKHTYGILIAARNEEKVIKNLLDSIYNQDYPQDKLKIFICANNCTDNTAQIIKEYINDKGVDNLYLLERDNPNERTKGFALKYTFEQIEERFGIKSLDGYFIFDADNVLRKDYITRMNEAFDSGEKIVTSCRFSKNMHQNWISFSYAVHWLSTCLLENRGKYKLGLSCRVQGTGFLFAGELVEKGWHYTSLTEDRAFCTDAVIKGYKVSYCEDAVFYDEQPYKFKISLRQRIRWAKGHLQSAVEQSPKLIKNIFKFDKTCFRSYDTFVLNFPTHIEAGIRKIITWACKFCLVVFLGNSFVSVFGSAILAYFIAFLIEYALSWLVQAVLPVLVIIVYRKQIGKFNVGKTILYCLAFPLFYKIGKWCAYIALFKKVEWKPIAHDTVMDLSQLNVPIDDEKIA